MDQKTFVAIGIGVLAGLAMNFVPTMIAFARQHPERRLIGQLNILSSFFPSCCGWRWSPGRSAVAATIR